MNDFTEARRHQGQATILEQPPDSLAVLLRAFIGPAAPLPGEQQGGDALGAGCAAPVLQPETVNLSNLQARPTEAMRTSLRWRACLDEVNVEVMTREPGLTNLF